MRKASSRAGYSLIEVLVALVLLLVLVQVVGMGLAVSHRADMQTRETERLGQMVEFVNASRSVGFSPESVVTRFKQEWPDTPPPAHDEIEDDDGLIWETWDIQSSKHSPQSTRISFLVPE